MDTEDRILIGFLVGLMMMFAVVVWWAMTEYKDYNKICVEQGLTYYGPARACLTTYGALIVPKEFQ
jgi:DNA-binding transcriptional regulator of glucitol operon